MRLLDFSVPLPVRPRRVLVAGTSRSSPRTHGGYRDRVLTALAQRPDLPVVRLTGRREVDTWAALLACRPPRSGG
ncbi:hypothetical protein [Rhodococcus pyridinivorans]|uniref:hypothetical protein n=1 Tax=Rhodococcus pyridinivorans TaxID=103816 RepID=UPI0036878548